MAKTEERFVVTGMGSVTSLGLDTESSWRNLIDGGHGIVDVSNSILEGYHNLATKVAAPVPDFSLLRDAAFDDYKKELKLWDPSAQFVLAAGAEALRQARLLGDSSLRIDSDQVDEDRFGVYVGTGIGGTNALTDARIQIDKEKMDSDFSGRTRVRPSAILNALPGRVASVPSKVFGAKAFWGESSRECASGNATIIDAIRSIKLGEADVVLAGGTEGEITPTTIAMFEATGAVDSNPDADQASRPFDEAHNGLVMSSGAGVLIIEGMEHAIRRGAPILAEVIGYHNNSDALYDTEPDPLNVIKCIQKAVLMTGLSEDELRDIYVNPHATGTIVGDQKEMEAISSVFRPEQLAGMSSTKGATGHMMGAAGAVEAIFSIQAMRENVIPPSLKLVNPIKETDGYIGVMSPRLATPKSVNIAVNNSFGFGGANAVTIFSRQR